MKSNYYYIKVISSWLMDILLPEKCLKCNKKGSILCKDCAYHIRRAERETSSGIIALYDYRDPIIKKTIWNLKYYRHKNLGHRLGEILYESFIEEISDMKMLAKGSPLLVIPVPLSRTKKKTRGYNQAEIITRSFCDCGNNKILEMRNDIIIKKIDTIPQARINNRVARLRNIHGAFEIIRPDLALGRTIIIIDDVTTTGGTITEIIKILKKAGAKKVLGLALAH